MPLKMLIAADDFTGALDTAVQFSAKGANVRMTYEDWRAAFSEETEVLSVDLETRHCTPDTARERTVVVLICERAKNSLSLQKDGFRHARQSRRGTCCAFGGL